jgi:hypothetical protein
MIVGRPVSGWSAVVVVVVAVAVVVSRRDGASPHGSATHAGSRRAGRRAGPVARLDRTVAQLPLDPGALVGTDLGLRLGGTAALLVVPEPVAVSQSGRELLLANAVALGEGALVGLFGASAFVGADVLLDFGLTLGLLGLPTRTTATPDAAADHRQTQPEQQHRSGPRHEQPKGGEADLQDGQVEVHGCRYRFCPHDQQDARCNSDRHENQAKEYHGETSSIGAQGAPFELRP